jgi:hypothetical protein
MEQLTRADIKQIIEDAIKPILVEIKASDNAHNTEIERLTKQQNQRKLRNQQRRNRLKAVGGNRGNI